MGFDASSCGPWSHHELAVDDVNLFRDLAGRRDPAVLSRTCADPSASARWREVTQPLGLDAEVRLTADDAGGAWGAVELHRETGAPDFDEAECALRTALGPVIAQGLRRVVAHRSALDGCGVDGPGLLLVAPDGTVSPRTAAGEAWLAAPRAASPSARPRPAPAADGAGRPTRCATT